MNQGEIKTDRIRKIFACLEADKVPKIESYWPGFIKKWKAEKGNHDIAVYYDFDGVWMFPNIEPHIKKREIIEKGDNYEVWRSGFGYLVREQDNAPMAQYLEPMFKDISDYDKLVFDDPKDTRRFYDPIDDILVRDGIPFAEWCDRYRNNFCIMGGACEPYEYIWRLRGSEEALIDIILYPDVIKRFAERFTDWMISNCEVQIEQGVSGFFVAGDVAYHKGMMFSPKLWREIFEPSVKRMWSFFKENNVIGMYHGCGAPFDIMDDLVNDVDIKVFNPLEVKAGFDVVEMKRKYGRKLAYYGNIDVRILEHGTKEDVEKEVLYKLNAAKGGGYVPASDHSVSWDVKVENFDYMHKLIDEYGKYPLSLGKYDVDI